VFRLINEKADQFLRFNRDKLYGPYLKFFLQNRFLGLAIPMALLIISIGGIQSKIVRTSFFPSLASDRVSISLAMPQGTNERITDSIISVIEEAAWQVNDEYTEKQTGNQQVVENIIKRIKQLSEMGFTHAIFNMPDVYTISPLETFAKEIIPAVAEL